LPTTGSKASRREVLCGNWAIFFCPEKSRVAEQPVMRMMMRMRVIKYCVYKEPPYFVAQCLNVDVSSFGDTLEQAIANLKEAVELYFEGSPGAEYQQIDEVVVGESLVHG
jgi:predicted RNase H-like HicB family nuclease